MYNDLIIMNYVRMNPKQLQNDKMFVHHVVLEDNQMILYLMKGFYHPIHSIQNHVDYEFDLFEKNHRII